ncbi:MAG: biopolymer transporter ExbD [Myxococcales bacterium]|nr:biopolymer transporter ExbD [Myxococcales bacterium]
MARVKVNKVEDLNLIPLMNLFVTMIPLLLLTAAFYHIGMVSVSVPTQSTGESSVETGKASVTVNVKADPKGLTITASSGTISPDELKALDAFIPKKGNMHDAKALTAALERIKRKYEQSDTMMLVPHKTTSYNQMIKLMDAARTMKASVGGKMRKLPLFPVVVVTSLVE